MSTFSFYVQKYSPKKLKYDSISQFLINEIIPLFH